MKPAVKLPNSTYLHCKWQVSSETQWVFYERSDAVNLDLGTMRIYFILASVVQITDMYKAQRLFFCFLIYFSDYTKCI